MILELFLACVVLLLTKWHLYRRKQYRLLTDIGYNVPPTNYIFGNLHQLGEMCQCDMRLVRTELRARVSLT